MPIILGMSTSTACLPVPAASAAPLGPGEGEHPDRVTTGLWVAYKGTGDRRVRERLLVHYGPLVRLVAARVFAGLPQLVDEADLVGYGTFGLIDAVEKFDLALGVRFETYAVARIRGAIIDELRSLDWVPRSVRLKARELERAAARLAARLGRAPTEAELAAETGTSVASVRRVADQVARGGLVALDAPPAGGGGEERCSLGDTVADRAEGPAERLGAEDDRRVLVEAVNRLDDRDKLVVCLVYYEGLTLARIAEALGVTESRVCQIHTKALARLQTLVRRAEREPVAPRRPAPRLPEPIAA